MCYKLMSAVVTVKTFLIFFFLITFSLVLNPLTRAFLGDREVQVRVQQAAIQLHPPAVPTGPPERGACSYAGGAACPLRSRGAFVILGAFHLNFQYRY